MTDKILIDRAVVEQALEALSNTGTQRGKQPSQFHAESVSIEALRAALEQPQDIAYHEAVSLAKWLFRKHFAHEEDYASGRVVWEPCDTTVGVISQIDNMVCKLVRQQPQVEQEPAPNGATHRQPKQGAFYKRVDGKWYVWSRMENGEPHMWYISPGTAESCLEPIYTHPQPPHYPLTDEQKAAITRELNQARCLEKRVVGNIELTDRIARAIEAAHGIGGEK